MQKPSWRPPLTDTEDTRIHRCGWPRFAECPRTDRGTSSGTGHSRCRTWKGKNKRKKKANLVRGQQRPGKVWPPMVTFCYKQLSKWKMEPSPKDKKLNMKHSFQYLKLFFFVLYNFTVKRRKQLPAKEQNWRSLLEKRRNVFMNQVQLYAEMWPWIILLSLNKLIYMLFILAKTLMAESVWKAPHELLQVLTGTHRTEFDRCSRALLCCSPDPFYTPHRCSRPSSWPSFPWCRHILHDTSWYISHSQCRTFTEKQNMNI